MKKKLFLPLVTALMLSLTACGSSSYTSNDSFGVAENTVSSNKLSFNSTDSYGSSDSYDYAESPRSTDYSGKSESEIVKQAQMIIRDARLQVDVESLEEFDTNLEKTVTDFDGYFEQSEINNYSNEYARDRYAYFTIRIPCDKLDEFLNIIDGTSNITSKNISTEDVSLEYIDVKAHIEALENEMTALKQLQADATDVSTLLEIESRMSDVQYQLDSANGQKRYLEGRVSYSTVNITAHEERNIEHPVRRAFEINFKERMIDGMENAVETLVGIITSIPVIIIVTAFILFFIWIIRKLWRKIFKTDKRRIKYMWMPVEMTPEIKAQIPEPKKEVSTVDTGDAAKE